MLILSSCSKSQKLSTRMEEFGLRFLFIEGAVFTLHGSKPITEIVLDRRPKNLRELEYQQSIAHLTEDEKKAVVNQPTLKWDPQCDFEETWDMWESKLEREHIHKFLLVHFPRKIEHLDFIYLVNIIETATLLKQHYALFKEYVGFDFDPLSVIFDIEDHDSIFWNKIFNNGSSQDCICLMGLLFGYGFENSYPFSLFFSSNRKENEMTFISNMYGEMIRNTNNFDCSKISSKQFPLPGFKVFSLPNPTLEKYTQEREEIKRHYNPGVGGSELF